MEFSLGPVTFGLWGILPLLIGLALYFLPTIIAVAFKKRHAVWIVLVNALTGWTFIGWVVALTWSLAAARER